MKLSTRLLIIAFVIALAMIHPTIRTIVWWILPFGSGTDDIVFWIAFSVGLSIAFIKLWTYFRPNKHLYERREKEW